MVTGKKEPTLRLAELLMLWAHKGIFITPWMSQKDAWV